MDDKVSFVIHDIEKLKSSVEFIKDKFEDACKKGFFSLDDAFSAKVSCENLKAAVDSLNDFQEFAKKMEEQHKKSEEASRSIT